MDLGMVLVAAWPLVMKTYAVEGSDHLRSVSLKIKYQSRHGKKTTEVWRKKGRETAHRKRRKVGAKQDQGGKWGARTTFRLSAN